MWDHIINIHLSELLSTKNKETKINEPSKINKIASQYQKLIINKKMKILHFLSNYIFTNFLKS